MNDNTVGESIAQLTALYDAIATFLVTYSFQIIGAIVISLAGLLVANKASNWVKKICLARHLDVTLTNFVCNLVKITVVVMTVVVVLNKLGINITPMVAAIGALSLGVGLAVQGLLSNYSAGLNIIVTRPYLVGDTISLLGVTGVVKQVNLATTVLTNEDEEQITIPNRHVIGEIIHNSNACRVVELSISVAYNSNLDLAEQVMLDAFRSVVGNDSREPQIGINNFADSGIELAMRFWAPTTKYFEQKFLTNRAIYDALIKNNIEIPFPQREVRFLNSSSHTQ